MAKTALVIFDKCKPQLCPGGVCAAAAACERRLITQDSPNEIPMTNPALCKGCADCVRSCPAGAIEIFN